MRKPVSKPFMVTPKVMMRHIWDYSIFSCGLTSNPNKTTMAPKEYMDFLDPAFKDKLALTRTQMTTTRCCTYLSLCPFGAFLFASFNADIFLRSSTGGNGSTPLSRKTLAASAIQLLRTLFSKQQTALMTRRSQPTLLRRHPARSCLSYRALVRFVPPDRRLSQQRAPFRRHEAIA